MAETKKIQKNDFAEIDFTGKFGENIFDTTSRTESEKIGAGSEVKPIIICIGKGMVLKGFDDFLEGKEIGKKYSLHLMPSQAFGIRNPGLIKIIPMKIFMEKNMNPVAGMTIHLDNYVAKILSVSGGRVSVDFNNPLAGKEIDYDFQIIRKIEDIKEKIDSLQDFFFKKRFDFEIDEKNKKIIFKEKKMKEILKVFFSKFKEMTGFEFEIMKDKSEEKQEKTEDKKDKN